MLIVNTNSLKHLSLLDACEFIRNLGIFNVELTTDGRAHAYPYLIDQPTFQLKDQLKQKGIKCNILSGGWVDFFNNDTELVHKQVEIASSLGVNGIRFFISNPHKEVYANADNLIMVSNRVRDYTSFYQDVNFLFENHGGLFKNPYDFCNFCKLVRLPNVGMVFDPANFLVDNTDPLDALRLIYPHIKHVHVKDITTDKQFVAVGEGIVPWKEIVKFLTNKGYVGDYSIEFEGHQYTNLEKEEGLIRSLNSFKGIF